MRDVRMPGSLDELWEALESAPKPMVYAGGTDLLVRLRAGLWQPESLVCLERIPELKGVQDHGDRLRLGSCTTHASLSSDPLVGQHLPVLVQALKTLGSPLIRNMGTLGGNLCTASPAGDTLPPLCVLGATVELLSREGSRTLPIETFITGPGATRLRDGEILGAVWVRKPDPGLVQHFEKVGLRNALACSVVSLASLLRLGPGGEVEEVTLAWGSVGPTVVRCPEAEATIRGERLSAGSLLRAGHLARDAVSPISDVRAGAEYRRAVAGNLLLRLALYGRSPCDPGAPSE